jgi:dihydroorotate dehydrogenase
MSGFYRHVIKPALFRLPPETAHNLLCKGLGLLEVYPAAQAVTSIATWANPNPILSQTLWGHVFEHPVGLAAGFDKNARYVHALQALGFSFVEVGSLTAQPSAGNAKPRLFRLPEDEALINRMGLNNVGLEKALPQLKRASHYGLNITKTPGVYGQDAMVDMANALRLALTLPARYLALNMSCPNTQDGKSFEEPDAFAALLGYLRQVETETGALGHGDASLPWLVKLSSDVAPSVLSELLAIGREHQLSGWILANTSTSRRGLKTSPKTLQHYGQGGLSGAPLREASTRLLADVYRQTRCWEIPPVLIGVGGIHDVDSAWDKITHGASLLQCYTGWIYRGPGFPKELTVGLVRKLSEKGFSSMSQAVGSAIKAN